jgi:hypothetical protein
MLAILIAASILGVMLFVSFVVLPVTFAKLPENLAGIYVRKLFPLYHITLFVASQIAGLLAYTPHLKPIAFIAGIVFAVHFLFLTPAINHSTDSGNAQRFKFLHLLSVSLHLAVMVLYAFAIFVDACLL